MSHHKDFIFHLYPQDFEGISLATIAIQGMVKVYVLCKYSLLNNPHINIKDLIHNLLTAEEIKNIINIKTDFTYNEIMSLKKNNIDFYIVDKERLSKIFLGLNLKNVYSNICYFKFDGKNLLYFYNEIQFISFKGTMQSNNNTHIKLNKILENINFGNDNDKIKQIADQKIQLQVYEIDHLKKQLEEFKKQNETLKKENESLKNNLSKANNINLDIKKYQEKIKENEYLKEQNIQLKYQIKELNFILQSVNEEPKVSINDIIVVNFISGDSTIHCGIKCFLSDTFASIEEKLYKRYENHRETNNIFTTNGRLVLRFKTLEENGIKDGDIVQLIVQE